MCTSHKGRETSLHLTHCLDSVILGKISGSITGDFLLNCANSTCEFITGLFNIEPVTTCGS